MTEILNPPTGFLHPFSIRTASAADCPSLIPLINAAFSIETFLEGTRTDESRLTAMMEKGTILVAEDSSARLLGCVYVEVGGDRGYMGQLAVDRAHQRAGLGRILVEAAESHLRKSGCKAVDIVVLSLRPELPPVYRRIGYLETGTGPFTPQRSLAPGVECHGIFMSKQF
jgi:ribosomal protein S18 acetylase RimI-like enzyme